MAIVGPGTQQQVTQDPTSLLDGASEYEYITLLNPLSDDFAVMVAQDVPINMPFSIGKDDSGRTSQTTLTERDAAQTYGLSLKNPDFVGRKHIANTIEIPAGQTINLKGNEAQVALRQLVNELMQREGNTRLMSDPTLRREAEQRIVQHRGSVQDLLDGTLQSQRSQIDDAISKSNEVRDEQPFPGLHQPAAEQTPAGSNDSGTEGGTQERRSPGRPKKTS